MNEPALLKVDEHAAIQIPGRDGVSGSQCAPRVPGSFVVVRELWLEVHQRVKLRQVCLSNLNVRPALVVHPRAPASKPYIGSYSST
jgi:hypothetical protein